MSNGVFYSGDLSTAASRQIPTAPTAATQSTNDCASLPTTSPPPLYARFRQSTSPLLNNDTTLVDTTSSKQPDNRAIPRTQSFLQIEDLKSKTNARADPLSLISPADNNHAAHERENESQQLPRRTREGIPSLTIKNGDDPFYRANFDYATTEAGKQPHTNAAIDKDSGPESPKETNPIVLQAQHSKGRSKSASGSIGNRILAAFRSNAHAKGDSQVHIKSVSVSQATSATYPAVRQHPEPGAKTSVANIFSSISAPGLSDTARSYTSKTLNHGPESAMDEESENKLSDSGIGKSPVKQASSDGSDKPANPEEVLKRLEEPTKPVNAIRLIAGEPPTTSSKALDRLIGIPNETPAKAVSTLTGIQISARPESGNYGTRMMDARQSMFSVRSDASTVATTYKEGKDDADESDVDTTVSTLGPLVPGSLPRAGRPFPYNEKSDWERDRERKASAHSTSSDSSAAAVFSPAPPVPTVPTRMLASGLLVPQQTRNPLLRQAIASNQRPNTAESTSTRPNTSESYLMHGHLRPGVWNRDVAHDAMSSGDEGLRPGTGISVATFETALSHHDNQVGEDDDQPVGRSDAALRGSRSPSSVLVPKTKHVKPTNRAEKRISKALSDAPSTRSQQSAQTNATMRDGPRKTLASLYLVAGLPKDPNNWALADNDSDIGTEASHMENAVPRWFKAEVLGSMVSGGGEAAPDALEGFQGRNGNGRKYKTVQKGRATGAKNILAPSPMTTIDEQPTLSKEEIAKIQAKAIKLSMPRDVEIIAAATAPPATSHTFSFTIKASSSSNQLSSGSIKGALGASWDLALAQSARPASTDRDDQTYYGASLVVWTHADKTRTDAIRAAIEVGGKARSLAVARAAKAAAAGRKFGERIARREGSGTVGLQMGSKAKGHGAGNVTSGGETEFETEVYMESEWEGRGAAPLSASTTELPFLKSSTFWLPYALTLVSKYPIYDLLTDTLRLSWARYHLNIARHSLTMRSLLEFPAPRPSERFKIPVDPLADAEGAFVMRFPGKVSLNSITADIDFQIWPVLRCLDADNLLRIAEIALSPLGRVVFFCQHVHMLNVAVETFRHLLEPRGWKGIVHGVVHTRDIKVFIEDPGPFLIGIDSRCINIAKEKVDPEICYVDLETNDVRCQQPPPGSLFKGTQRERLVKKLSEAIGGIGYYGVPPELTDAFPGSRFRPFSQVEVNGRVAPAERLLPPANWNYDQERFLSTFDAIISIRPSTNVLQRLLHLKNSVRKAAELSTNAQHVQQIVRNQSNNFVDKRDLMEAKLWRMNKRLALLMQESQNWNSQFNQFQGFTEKLNTEAIELKTKLEKERREAKRLSNVVHESKQAQEELSRKLQQAEESHNEAMKELKEIEEIKKELQDQRDIMFNELLKIASITNNSTEESNEILDEIYDKIEMKIETLSTRSSLTATSPSHTHTMPRSPSRSSMTLLRTASKASMRSEKAASRGPVSPSRSGSTYKRSRKTSVTSNGTIRTLTELAEEEAEHGHDVGEHAKNGNDRLLQEGDDEEEGDIEEDDYLEMAAMRRMAITETMRSIQERLQIAMAAAQARASSVALPTPLPSSGTSSPILHRASASQQARSTTTASPEFLVRKSSSRKVGRATDTIDENDDDDDDMKKPRIPKKSKSRTVIGHPGSSRKVDVPTSASESEGD